MRDQQQTRINRVSRRASPAIQESYEQGKISLRRADILLHLPPEEGARQVSAILEKQEKIASRSRIAAAVIRSHLESGRRDLAMLATDLRSALRDPQTIG
jgi:hypothetical protein